MTFEFRPNSHDAVIQIEIQGLLLDVAVMVKMDPPKLVPPGTNFPINKDPPELILLDSL